MFNAYLIFSIEKKIPCPVTIQLLQYVEVNYYPLKYCSSLQVSLLHMDMNSSNYNYLLIDFG